MIFYKWNWEFMCLEIMKVIFTNDKEVYIDGRRYIVLS